MSDTLATLLACSWNSSKALDATLLASSWNLPGALDAALLAFACSVPGAFDTMLVTCSWNLQDALDAARLPEVNLPKMISWHCDESQTVPNGNCSILHAVSRKDENARLIFGPHSCFYSAGTATRAWGIARMYLKTVWQWYTFGAKRTSKDLAPDDVEGKATCQRGHSTDGVLHVWCMC